MKLRFLIFILALLVACACYDQHSSPSQDLFNEASNYTFAQLRQLCEKQCATIDEDLICIGRITSSDRESNFYRTLVIEEASGAAEIKVGTHSLASKFPIGLEVALRLNGTAVKVENGVIQVGLPPQIYDSTPREMEAWAVINKHLIRGTSVESIEPLACDIASLDITQCGRFVKIDNLSYTPLDEIDTTAEYLRFTDKDNNVIFLYISQYADFVEHEIPTSEISVRGILYHENIGHNIGKQFVIKPRFADDISTIGHTY